MDAVILAGGQSRRFSHGDKALALYGRKTLIEHVYQRVAPQVGRVFVSSGRSYDDLPADVTCLGDNFPGMGPMAGIEAALSAVRKDYLLAIPCDMPLLPQNLAQMLLAAIDEAGATLAVACTDVRCYPVVLLMHRDILPDIRKSLLGNQLRMMALLDRLDAVRVPFADEAAFANCNCVADLESLPETDT